MDEHAQQRTRQALFDAMELLDNKPEKFCGDYPAFFRGN